MILVTGATGNVGRNVVRQLLDEGEKVRVLLHGPGALPDEVEVVRGDLTQVPAAALDGVDRVFLFPLIEAVSGFVDVAVKASVEHIVMLSTAAVTFAEPGWVGERHREVEAAVTASGLSWSFVRPGAFMANDLVWAPQVKDGVVRAAYGDATSAPIDERDVAAVAVRALVERHTRQAHILSGPESLTQVERVRILAEVLGRPVRFEEQSRQDARERLLKLGLTESAIEFGMDIQASSVNITAEVLPAVEEITGRPAHTYAEWVAHRAADFSG
jgi:uncharacterized protein YbjT (DUF2867 family)